MFPYPAAVGAVLADELVLLVVGEAGNRSIDCLGHPLAQGIDAGLHGGERASVMLMVVGRLLPP